MKMTNFWRNNLAIFLDVKKIEIYFPYNTFFLIFVNKEILFQEYIEMEFRMVEIKHSDSNFDKQASFTCR